MMNEENRPKIITSNFEEIPVDKKTSINIGRATRSDKATPYIDIRKFKLYGSNNDNKKKYTPKGIGISLEQLPDVLTSLLIIYECEFGKPFNLEYNLGLEELLSRKEAYLKIMNGGEDVGSDY